MMMLGNWKYAIYIGLVTLAVILSFAFYHFWKRRMLAIITGNRSSPVMLQTSPKRAAVKTVCIFISILLFAIVMLRPQWGQRMREVQNEGSDVLVALDVSRSMLARDVGTSRLERAKDAIRWIAGSLRGDRIGLIVFAGDSFLLCPLTSDIGAFMMFLDSAGPDSVQLQGTDIGAMFSEAYRVFQKKRLTSKMLVLITDGEDHQGAAIPAMEKFKELGVSVYAMGIGRDRGGFIPADGNGGEVYLRDADGKLIRTASDSSLLKKLAGATGGAYMDISDSFSDMHFILEVIDDQQKNRYESRVVKEPVERFAPFAALLLVLLSIELMLPERPFRRTGEKKGALMKFFNRKKEGAE